MSIVGFLKNPHKNPLNNLLLCMRAEIEYAQNTMAEWLILLLLVPADVVPVVLLVGFAGCDQVFGLETVVIPPPVPVVPVIVSAVGKSGTVITLTWTYSGSAAEFEFERMKLPERTRETFPAAASPPDDDKKG